MKSLALLSPQSCRAWPRSAAPFHVQTTKSWMVVVIFILALWSGSAGAATFTVTNTDDTGGGSLRQAILDANESAVPDTIVFDIPDRAPHSIALVSPLPDITSPVAIDGWTQPGFSGVPILELDGSLAGAHNGLTITAGNCIIRGLILNNFGSGVFGHAVEFRDMGGNIIEGCYVGVDSSGTAAAKNWGSGVVFFRSSNNIIGGVSPQSRNVLSGNLHAGLLIVDQLSTNNHVIGNFIGTDAKGVTGVGNGEQGIKIDEAPLNILGGPNPGEGNLISGNGYGITIGGSLAAGNKVQGNLIGTDLTGTKPIGNAFKGLRIGDGSDLNLIGGTMAGARNIISGNLQSGLEIDRAGQAGNAVRGNYVGTDVTGTRPVPNGSSGVLVFNSASNLIGGTFPGEGNLVSGNQGAGIMVSQEQSTNNQVKGNFVGTDFSGARKLGNGGVGVYIINSGTNTIGGVESGARNLISGNGSEGIALGGTNAVGNIIQGNFIGTDVSGSKSIANFYNGVNLGGARFNLIGGTNSGAGNVISGNSGAGIHTFDANTTDNLILGNFIGTDPSGALKLGNGNNGVWFDGGSRNRVGGVQPGEPNLIAFNPSAGIRAASGSSNTFRGNSIWSNSGLGIDLGASGLTANDLRDSDNGANGLQNYPLLTNLTSGAVLNARGRLNSKPNATYSIDFYGNSPDAVVLAVGGQSFLGSMTVTTDSAGNASFEQELPAQPDGFLITATATDPFGNTSEFSGAAAVSGGGGPLFVQAPSSADVLQGGSLKLSALAIGKGILRYQWSKDGVELPGSNQATLELPSATYQHTGYYSVRVSDDLGSLQSSPAKITILPGWTQWKASEGGNGHFYRLTSLPMNWDAAEKEAQGLGGHLVAINSPSESDFVAAVFLQTPNLYRPHWIGLNDLSREGTFAWSSGEPVTFKNWFSGEPNNLGTGEDYVSIGLNRALGVGWNDNPVCGSSNNDIAIDGPYYGLIETAEDPQKAPIIEVGPIGGALSAGSSFGLHVSVVNGPTLLSYQWRRNGVEIPGATSADLMLTNVTVLDAGRYSVLVRGGDSATVSGQAEVTVWSQWPESGHYYGLSPLRQNFTEAESWAVGAGAHLVSIGSATEQDFCARLFVQASAPTQAFWIGFTDQREEGRFEWTSGEPVTYTFWDSSEPNNFGGNEDYTLFNFVRARDGGGRGGGWADEKLVGDVRTLVTRAQSPYHGMVETPYRPPLLVEIVAQPAAAEVKEGGEAELKVRAVGLGDLVYQWMREGRPIAGATASSLKLTNLRLEDSGAYSVVVSAPNVNLPSAAAILTVEPSPPVITSHPTDLVSFFGETATFSVVASGAGPLAFQWRRDGLDLRGETNSVLVLGSLRAENAGAYSVVVSNAGGSVSSGFARLAVEPCLNTPDGLAAWWPGDQDANEKTSGTPGELVGQVRIVPALNKGGFRFDGPGAHVDVGNEASLNPRRSFTIAAWVYPDALDSWRMIFTKWDDNQKRFFYHFAIHDGRFGIGVSEGGGDFGSGCYDDDLMEANRWSFLAASVDYSTGQIRIYRDGVFKKVLPYHGSLGEFPDVGSVHTYIGGKINGSFSFSGVIDEPILFSRVLTPGEIAAIYSAGGAGICKTATPPRIVSQPVVGPVSSGGSAILSVSASASGAVSYQWRLNGIDLPNATNATLSLNNLRSADAGSYSLRVSNEAGVVISQAAELIVLEPPSITEQPQSTPVVSGETVRLEVVAAGTDPLSYEWQKDGQTIDGQIGAFLEIASAKAADAGGYRAIVRNASGVDAVSQVAQLTVVEPPVILSQPSGGTLNRNQSLTLQVTATGSAPLRYQWRLNGQNLPGQAAATLVIPSAQLADAGLYTVVVANDAGSVTSQPAEVKIDVPAAAFGDNFAQATALTTATGEVSGNNERATVEQGEPLHAGHAGGRSVWFRWRAPADGRARFTTIGSSFDTLLAVYRGEAVNSLTTVGADDDRVGFFASQVTFNSLAGADYLIALDAFNAVGGNFVLTWSFTANAPRLPEITRQPLSQTVLAGSSVTLEVVAAGTGLTYQWLFNGVNVPGATLPTLRLDAVGRGNVGGYVAAVRNPNGDEVRSQEAVIEIGPQPDFRSVDKPEFNTRSGPPVVLGWHRPNGVVGAQALAVSFGSAVTQTYSQAGAGTQQFETNSCSYIGGRTKWVKLRADTTGTMFIRVSAGFETALYFRDGRTSELIASDCASRAHELKVAVQAGAVYWVVTDSVAEGPVDLETVLGRAPQPSTVEPAEQALLARSELLLRVPDSALGEPPGSFQWFMDGQALAGATARELRLSVANRTARYSVVVSNALGRVEVPVARVRGTQPLRLLSDLSTLRGSTLEVMLEGTLDQGVEVQATRDWLRWDRIWSGWLGGDGAKVQDELGGSTGIRFYRAAEQEVEASGVSELADGGFDVSLTGGLVGDRFVLERRGANGGWLPVATNTVQGAELHIHDPTHSPNQRPAYRALKFTN